MKEENIPMKVKLCRESLEDMFKEMEELTGCKNPIILPFVKFNKIL